MDTVDVVVVGAGVVGLAVARALAMSGREVLVLERESGIGMGTSSRNSEVIHAGIYYPAGSLKARLCVQGRRLLYAYCSERGIPHQRCGKLIVANTPSQVAALSGIAAKARINGVDDLALLDAAQALALEPLLRCEAALLSPSTGIVDSHALMLALQGDLESAGGMTVFHAEVDTVEVVGDGFVLRMKDGTELQAALLINSAGLHACALAACTAGLHGQHIPRAWFAKGNYFTLSSGRSPFGRLVYPAPEPDKHLAGLGVHLTIDLGGQAKFGPDVQWTDSPDDLIVDPTRGEAFYAEIRQYWPGLPDGALQPGYAGVRPKITGPSDAAADFRIDGSGVHGVPGLVNLFGIESPGLTSSLAIGEHVATLLKISAQP